MKTYKIYGTDKIAKVLGGPLFGKVYLGNVVASSAREAKITYHVKYKSLWPVGCLEAKLERKKKK